MSKTWQQPLPAIYSELTDPERQADFLAAVRAAAGPALVVNARVDVFVRAS